MVLVLVLAPPPAVGGRLQQVVVGVLHGVEAQVLGQGHLRQRGDGAAMQHLVVVVVRGVQQEAVVVAGGQAAQLETRRGGVAQIRRHRAVGTCDGYCSLALEAVP